MGGCGHWTRGVGWERRSASCAKSTRVWGGDSRRSIRPYCPAAGGAKLVWELGGAIRPGDSYLLALNADDDGVYMIGVLFDGSMWWGEQAERISAAIRSGPRE